MKTIYIAGPMTGLPQYNFPAFDAAAEDLRAQGWNVISPAQLDRDAGFDPNRDEVTPEFLRGAMERDVAAIMRADAIGLLPGWEKSKGAKAEKALAEWLGIDVWFYSESQSSFFEMMAKIPSTKPEKRDDPKLEAGSKKPQLQLLPPEFNRQTAKALACGAAKYGTWNWRDTGVSVMTYVGAIRRHVDCILDGEDIDAESGAHHLGHIAACCAIVLDAGVHGKLTDDRPNGN